MCRRHRKGDGLSAFAEQPVIVGELTLHHVGIARQTPARSAAKGQAVAGALTPGVIDIAFTNRSAPMVVGEPAPVLACEIFNAFGEEIRLFVRGRRTRKLPVGDVAGERGLLKNVELIAVHPVEMQ